MEPTRYFANKSVLLSLCPLASFLKMLASKESSFLLKKTRATRKNGMMLATSKMDGGSETRDRVKNDLYILSGRGRGEGASALSCCRQRGTLLRGTENITSPSSACHLYLCLGDSRARFEGSACM